MTVEQILGWAMIVLALIPMLYFTGLLLILVIVGAVAELQHWRGERDFIHDPNERQPFSHLWRYRRDER